MRAVLDTTCDIIDGPSGANPGVVRHANVPCRIVPQVQILPVPKFLNLRTHWINMDEMDCIGAAIAAGGGPLFSVNLDFGDRIAIPSGAAADYVVLWTEDVTPFGEPTYRRANVTDLL